MGEPSVGWFCSDVRKPSVLPLTESDYVRTWNADYDKRDVQRIYDASRGFYMMLLEASDKYLFQTDRRNRRVIFPSNLPLHNLEEISNKVVYTQLPNTIPT
jgi:hypothetical protein